LQIEIIKLKEMEKIPGVDQPELSWWPPHSTCCRSPRILERSNRPPQRHLKIYFI